MSDQTYLSEPGYQPSPASVRRISWGAIIAGLFVTIVAQITLTLLGLAIGLATVNPVSEQNPGQGLGTAAAIWFIVSGLFSLFAGAYVSGRLAGGPRRADGLLHGIVMWSVAEVVMLALLTTSVGALIGGRGNIMSQVVANERAQSGNALAEAQQQLQKLMPQLEQNLSPTGRGSGTPNAPADEADERELQQRAASEISTGALIGFVGMVLGLGIAAWGGWIGTASLPRYRQRTIATPAA